MVKGMQIKSGASAGLMKRYMETFKGLDLVSAPEQMDIRRSPSAYDVWKDYSKGLELLGTPRQDTIYQFSKDIHSITDYTIDNKKVILIHSGTNIYKWENYPTVPPVMISIKSGVSDSNSFFFSFDNKIYYKDAKNYLYYDGTQVKNVLDEATIPITSFNRDPSGGGESFNPVNTLQAKRRNSFVGDGESKDYYLDVESCDSIDEVLIDGVLTNQYSVDITNGLVTFNTAPPKPDIAGEDNVMITFTRVVDGYQDRIMQCNISVQYDNRLFFSGNPLYPQAIFNSQREDPSYFPDVFYYEDGLDTEAVKSMVVGNKGLYVIKGGNGDDTTVYFHQGRIFYEDNVKVYPSNQTIITEPCITNAINFNGEVVYMSKKGLQGIVIDMNNETNIDLRSTLITPALNNVGKMLQWRDYLVFVADNYVYLADNKQRFQSENGIEYEWYRWDVAPSKLFVIDNNLFGVIDNKLTLFNTEFTGTLLWQTPYDLLSAPNKLKTLNKKGFIVYTNNPQTEGIIKIAAETDYAKVSTNDFSYNEYPDIKGYVVPTIKQKKFLGISFSIKAKKLSSLEYEAYISRYVKR